MTKRLGLIAGHMRSLPLSSDVVIAAQRADLHLVKDELDLMALRAKELYSSVTTGDKPVGNRKQRRTYKSGQNSV